MVKNGHLYTQLANSHAWLLSCVAVLWLHIKITPLIYLLAKGGFPDVANSYGNPSSNIMPGTYITQPLINLLTCLPG